MSLIQNTCLTRNIFISDVNLHGDGMGEKRMSVLSILLYYTLACLLVSVMYSIAYMAAHDTCSA